MKKTAIALAVFAAALFAVSCQKEIEAPETAETPSGPMVINAISEGMGVDTKVEMVYKYDLLWQKDDQIFVTDGSVNDTFTLTGGEGTTKGTFTQDGSVSFTGEVEAYYPQSLITDNTLVWPEVQTNDQTVPMYSSKAVSGNVEDFNFTSLGAMLQLVFNSTVDGVVLKSIDIKDGEKNMSGAFTVDENGQAIITAADGKGITLDLGAGKALGKGANFFNIAVPAGKYNDVTITFMTTDLHVCKMHSSKLPEIEHNTVCRITLAGTKFGDDALPGEFSVAKGRVVKFSQGNLYWDGDSYEFESTQLDYPVTHDDTHIGHFFWSNNPIVARASTYSDPDRGEHDVFFTNETEETPNPDFSVDGITGRFRTLSMNEWKYLFNYRDNASNLYKGQVTVCGKKNCIVIAPDNFKDEIKDSYTAEEWSAVEDEGLVCLPQAGYISIEGNPPSGGVGYYWSSAPWTSSGAQFIAFSGENDGVGTIGFEFIRNEGLTVRLVRDKEFVTSVNLDKTDLELSLKESVKLIANVLPADAPVKNVIWASDNPDVATVAADGTVTGVAVGTATITATTENAFKTATCTVTVLPHYAGEFSVNADGRKVRFSQGNLYWDGDSYEFENSQYDFPSSRDASHMGHFYWSQDPVVARASTYSNPDRKADDVFFTNETEDTASTDFTVGGITGRYRTLSMLEWKYLLGARTNAKSLHKLHVTVCGKEDCLIIAPDNFDGEINKTAYSAEEWQIAESEGLVCLPSAGWIAVYNIHPGGYYWSSAPWTSSGAQHIYFNPDSDIVSYIGYENSRDESLSVRLVTDCN